MWTWVCSAVGSWPGTRPPRLCPRRGATIRWWAPHSSTRATCRRPRRPWPATGNSTTLPTASASSQKVTACGRALRAPQCIRVGDRHSTKPDTSDKTPMLLVGLCHTRVLKRLACVLALCCSGLDGSSGYWGGSDWLVWWEVQSVQGPVFAVPRRKESLSCMWRDVIVQVGLQCSNSLFSKDILGDSCR